MPNWDNKCMGCFRDINSEDICPHCGFDEKTSRSPLALQYRTIVNNQYVIGKVLGKPGGFGTTYLGFDSVLNTKVAIKEYLPRELAGRAPDGIMVVPHTEEDAVIFHTSLERFLQEARTLVRIDHPNVVRVRNYLEANNTAYLVMSYYEGFTLSEYLEKQGGKLSEAEAIGFMRPILEGLREVHRKGFLHRDIKPGNIYITNNDRRPILLDFGAARSVVKENPRGLSVVLSPGFAPPEQYHRSGEQGTWTDVYGCAATLYYLTTGDLPPEVTERMAEDEPAKMRQKLMHLSSKAREAILKGMALAPKDRPQTVEQFASLLTGQPLSFSDAQTLLLTAEQPPLAPSTTENSYMDMAYMPTQSMLEAYFPHLQSHPEQITQERKERNWEWASWLILLAGIILAGVAFFVYFWQTNRPNHLVVSSKGNGNFHSIADAIKVASDGMKIYLEPGVYKESFAIDHPVELIGRKDKGEVIIETTSLRPIELKAPNIVLRGITVRAPAKTAKGAVALEISLGAPLIEDCTITSLDSTAILVRGKEVTPHFKKILVKQGGGDGIIFQQSAKGLLEDSEVKGQKGWGIIVRDLAAPMLKKSKVQLSEKGGILIENATPELDQMDISLNLKVGIYLRQNAMPNIHQTKSYQNGENGIFISQGSKGTFKEIEVYQNKFAGIAIRDDSAPFITASKIYDGKDVGIWIYEGGKGTIENSEIYNNDKHGIQVGIRAEPFLSRLRIHNGKQNGVMFHDAGKGKLDNSEVFENQLANIVITDGANPIISQSKLYGSKETGLSVTNGGRGTIERCQIYRNTFQNIHIASGGNPIIRVTDIYNGLTGGVWVTTNGSGTIEESNIYGNNKFGIGIENKGDPTIRKCKIYGGSSHGVWISSGGRGTLSDNQIYGNAEYGVYINPNTAPSLVNNNINSNAQGDVLDLGY